MDSISHLALGAIVAKAVVGEKYGNKVMVYGALAATIPDLDTLVTPFLTATNALFAHRGLSHSLVFMPIAAAILAFLSRFIDKDKTFGFYKRLLVLMLAWFSHIAVDIFNTYGTGIFVPFNPMRLAIDALPIFDITLIIVLVITALLNIFWKNGAQWHRLISFTGIVIVIVYISASTAIKFSIEEKIKTSLNVSNVYTSPLPITISKWMYVAEYANCYQVGYINPLDTATIEASEYILKNHNLLSEIENDAQIAEIKRFSKGFYSVCSSNNGFEIHDLRFSSMSQRFPEAYVLTFKVDTSNNDLKISKSQLKRKIFGIF